MINTVNIYRLTVDSLPKTSFTNVQYKGCNLLYTNMFCNTKVFCDKISPTIDFLLSQKK